MTQQNYFLGLLIVFLLLPLAVEAQLLSIVAIPADKTATLSNRKKNLDPNYLLVGKDMKNIMHRSMIQFDLSMMPVGTLVDATLTLTPTNGNTNLVSLHRMTQDWNGASLLKGEYSSNWFQIDPDTNWDSPGGDFYRLPSARGLINPSRSNDISGSGMLGDIHRWYNDPSSNYGWILLGQESREDNLVEFNSKFDFFSGPFLTMLYELPDSCYAYGGVVNFDNGSEILSLCNDASSNRVNLNVKYNQGENSLWIITNGDGVILDFNQTGKLDIGKYNTPTLHARHLSFNGELLGAQQENNISNLLGCHSFSPPLVIVNDLVIGGTLHTSYETENISLCQSELSSLDLFVTDNIGNSAWVIINEEDRIIDYSNDLSQLVNNLIVGKYRIVHFSFLENEHQLIAGQLYTGYYECSDWSNVVEIDVINNSNCEINCDIDDPSIDIASLEICPMDNLIEILKQIEVFDTTSYMHGIWVLTDRRGDILDYVTSIDSLQFNAKEGDLFYAFYVVSNDEQLEVSDNIYTITGCHGISLPKQISTTTEACIIPCEISAGQLYWSDFDTLLTACAGSQMNADLITTQGSGLYNYFLITDQDSMIIGITSTPINDIMINNEVGSFTISSITYDVEPDHLSIGSFLSDIEGCYNISNDVLLEISECPDSCMPPFSFEFDKDDNGNITVTWNDVPNAITYEFLLGFDGDTSRYTTINTSRNWLRLSNPSNRDILVKVRTECSEGEYSPFSDIFYFPELPGKVSKKRSTTKKKKKTKKKLNLEIVTLYPNPSKDILNISYAPRSENEQLLVISSTGQVHQSIALQQEISNYQVDVNYLPNGIHFIYIHSLVNKSISKQFIKIE